MIDIIPNWHPVWVHFVIGLLIIGTLFYAFAWIAREQLWTNGLLIAARWNLTVGMVFALVALLTGFLAAGSVPHDEAAHANILVHRNWALATALIFSVADIFLWAEWRQAARRASMPVLALLLAGSVALAVTGFEGGQNVFEHGLGVQRLPEAGNHDHAHGTHDHHGMEETHSDRQDAAPGDHDHHSHDHDAQEHEAEPAQAPAADSHNHEHSSSHGEHSH